MRVTRMANLGDYMDVRTLDILNSKSGDMDMAELHCEVEQRSTPNPGRHIDDVTAMEHLDISSFRYLVNANAQILNMEISNQMTWTTTPIASVARVDDDILDDYEESSFEDFLLKLGVDPDDMCDGEEITIEILGPLRIVPTRKRIKVLWKDMTLKKEHSKRFGE